MKHIIVDGGDGLGKNLLIEGLTKYFNFDNVTIRHFGKPPKEFPIGIDPLDFQFNCFEREAHLLNYIRQAEKDNYTYYDEVVIWNRSHLGEYPYGQMFRGQNSRSIQDRNDWYEECTLINNPDETFLIMLMADVEFFFKQEDGQSFSDTLKDKERELKLFAEAFKNSQIDNKLSIKVNDGEKYIPKNEILSQVLNFIKNE